MAHVRRAHSRSLFVMMMLLFVAGMWIAWTKWLVTNTSLFASNRLCILNLMIGECCFSKRRRYQRTWIARNARPLANLLHLRLKVRGSWFWFRLFQISGQIWPLRLLRLFGGCHGLRGCPKKLLEAICTSIQWSLRLLTTNLWSHLNFEAIEVIWRPSWSQMAPKLLF